jgi:hypothetical protein
MSDLSELNNLLFAQLGRLSKDNLDPEEIEREVKRTDALVDVSDQVLRIADTSLKAAKLYAEHGQAVLPHLPQIGGKSE